MIDFDELRGEIAKRHSVLLGKDDPIFVQVTLSDLVLSRYVEILSKQNEGHAKALSAALADQVEQSKAIGSRIITEAADYVARQIRDAGSHVLAEASIKSRTDLEEAKAANKRADSSITETTQLLGQTKRANAIAISASVVAVICAVVAMIAVFIK